MTKDGQHVFTTPIWPGRTQGTDNDAQLRVDREGLHAGTAGQDGVASGDVQGQAHLRSPAPRPEKRCFTYCGDDKCDCGYAEFFAVPPNSQADGDERNAHLKPLQGPDREAVARAICHAVNYHSLDAKLGRPDFEIAEQLLPEVMKWLRGETDVQVIERMSPEERAKIGTDALSSTSPAGSASGWRDIKTAPQDGTWFIAYENGQTYPCEWREDEPDEGPWRAGWFDHFNQSFENPTLWMPVSAAPTPEGE